MMLCVMERNSPDARLAVSMIVGRDTREAYGNWVTKAAVETIAENTSDGVIAPMFYMAVGGPADVFYKGDQYHGFHAWI